ncbi:MAG: hypothetical protein JWO55_475 [Candidatus Saccharibacteria bacterium]|jgi:hypothetical protein|nr:hypothetical protein [Candidatus Saccharibacteria bacterium]
MEHEHVIRIMDDHEIRRSNNEVGRLGVRAYQLQTMQNTSEMGRQFAALDHESMRIAQAVVPVHVFGQYELVLPIEKL